MTSIIGKLQRVRNSECGVRNGLVSNSAFPRPDIRDHRGGRIPHSAFAFTLVELLVVLGIIGLILSISVPALSGYSRQLRLQTSTRELVGLLSLARSKAISAHAEYAVVIDPEGKRVSVMEVASGEVLEQVVRLPSSVTLDVRVGAESAPETQLVFRPTGSLVGRTTTLVLADHERQHAITVVGATGAITVQ